MQDIVRKINLRFCISFKKSKVKHFLYKIYFNFKGFKEIKPFYNNNNNENDDEMSDTLLLAIAPIRMWNYLLKTKSVEMRTNCGIKVRKFWLSMWTIHVKTEFSFFSDSRKFLTSFVLFENYLGVNLLIK